jgi:phosphoribosylanthranilate isomerase
MKRTSVVKIKICGLTRLCEADYVNAALPDYAGFVFYEKSRRYISPEEARKLARAILPEIKKVGVFVDDSLEKIVNIYEDKIINIAQLHGEESQEYIDQLRKLAPDLIIWKAFKIQKLSHLQAAQESQAHMVLLDSGAGSGQRFDWALLENFQRPFILAGGLTPENIPQAISFLRPYAVDLSSGLEIEGLKNKDKIMAAVRAARSL